MSQHQLTCHGFIVLEWAFLSLDLNQWLMTRNGKIPFLNLELKKPYVTLFALLQLCSWHKKKYILTCSNSDTQLWFQSPIPMCVGKRRGSFPHRQALHRPHLNVLPFNSVLTLSIQRQYQIPEITSSISEDCPPTPLPQMLVTSPGCHLYF